MQRSNNAVDVGNPISVIKAKLQMLRSEKEVTETEIEALEHEKTCIRQALPKLLHELIQLRDSIYTKQRDMDIYDKAILEIETKYGHIIYSPDFFDNSENQHFR